MAILLKTVNIVCDKSLHASLEIVITTPTTNPSSPTIGKNNSASNRYEIESRCKDLLYALSICLEYTPLLSTITTTLPTLSTLTTGTTLTSTTHTG